MKTGPIVALTVIVLLMATPAYAYVDPNTGGMLVQLLTGGAAGALVLARLYWRRLKEKVTGKPAPGTDQSTDKPETPASGQK